MSCHEPGQAINRRTARLGFASIPLSGGIAGCASLLGNSYRARGLGFDGDSLKETVDRDQIKWAMRTESFAVSEPVATTYPPVTLLVQGSLRPINLGREMSAYTSLDDVRAFAREHGIDPVADTPTVWLYQWVSRAQGPMIFETGFVVPDGTQCPQNARGYRIKQLGPVRVSSIVYRGPYRAEPGSGWDQIRWAERAKEKGFEYTEQLYRELYFRDGKATSKLRRITVVEISIA